MKDESGIYAQYLAQIIAKINSELGGLVFMGEPSEIELMRMTLIIGMSFNEGIIYERLMNASYADLTKPVSKAVMIKQIKEESKRYED